MTSTSKWRDLNSKQLDFLYEVYQAYGDSEVSSSQLIELAKNKGFSKPQWMWGKKFQHLFKKDRGKYVVPATLFDLSSDVVEAEVQQMTVDADNLPSTANTENLTASSEASNLIPRIDPLFVSFGNQTTLMKVIKSNTFFPVYIPGLSGNGKTFGTEQACAKLRRPMIRVNLTIQTDEDDLIGGMRLVNGDTVFVKGPVIRAMELGAILLLDEVEKADAAKIMCLQSILEGSGYYIKKTGEYISPARGFNVIATANTKGKGDETGNFITSNIMDEAFLERFPITLEQEYPNEEAESRILTKLADSLSINDMSFIDVLINWANTIRAAYDDEQIDSVISTRRLVHILRAYSVFGKRMMALELCIARFDAETRDAFKQFYEKLDADAVNSAKDPWNKTATKQAVDLGSAGVFGATL